MSLVKYWGIADSNGLQSFMRISKTLQSKLTWEKFTGDKLGAKNEEKELNISIAGAVLSCRYNAQRHSVVYKVELEDTDSKIIEELMKTKSADALKMLKEKAKEIALAKDVPGAKGMWDKIPNKNTDPF